MSTLAAARRRLPRPGTARVLALVGTAGLTFTPLSVLYEVASVTGGRRPFLALVAGVVLAAAAVSRRYRVRTVAGVATALLAVGLVAYTASLPANPPVRSLLASNLELLSGRSVLRIKQTTLWVLAVTPAPTFLTTYLALRRWYTGAVVVGGATLGYFVLTTDAGTALTLLGVVSAAATVGFGDIDSSAGARAPEDRATGADERAGRAGAVTAVAVVLAVMVVAPLAVPAVPGSGAGPLSLAGGGDRTVEASLISVDSQIEVLGSITLSPSVRFTVDSPVGSYWRVGSYDRYTGDGWVRTGGTRPYAGDLRGPVGPAARVTQRVTVESQLSVMPAAWRPVTVDGAVAADTSVTDGGGLRPTEPLSDGDSYTVTSAVPRPGTQRLATAGRDYPERVRERFTQLPADTPDRVARRTARLTAAADTPYETARTIEAWLERNREYSLEVDRPRDNVADAFLFEMERGYCTYYATTMVTMLRTQDIPARLVVGYTTGQEVGGSYVVRGYDSHAWVEVYFPDVGWVRFDPTPSGPREAAERDRLDRAEANGRTDVAPDRTPTPTPTPSDPAGGTPTASPEQTATPNVTVGVGQTIGGGADQADDGDGGFELPEAPTREELLLGGVVVAGAVAGLRRLGLTRQAALWARSRLGGDDAPAERVERTYRRLEAALERRHRPRGEAETVRAYLAAVDAPEPAHDLARLRERVRYGGGEVTEETVAEARRLLAAARDPDSAEDGHTAASSGG